jgi:hypothetical protein
VQERVKGLQSAIHLLTQLENMASINVAIFNPEHSSSRGMVFDAFFLITAAFDDK